jgi:methyl-accepting chemotaxis protein
LKYEEQIKKEEQERVRLNKDLEFAVEQARIDAMSEGLEKVLAQSAINYDKEIEQIKHKREDLLKQIQYSERTIWESQNPDWEKQGKKFKPATIALSKEYLDKFTALEKTALRNRAKNNEDSLKDLKKQYQDYSDKRKGIEVKFDKDIAAMQARNSNGQLTKNIQEAKKQKDKELGELDATYIESSEKWALLFKDIEKRSLKTIKNTVAELRKMVLTIADPKIKKQFMDMLDEVEKKVAKSGRAIEAMFGNSKGAGFFNMFFGEGDLEQKLESFQTIFTGAKGDMASMAGTSGQVAGNAGKAASAMQGAAGGASGTLAIIDAIIKSVHQTIQAVQQSLEAIAELRDSMGIDDSDSSFGKWNDYIGGLGEFDSKAYSGWENLKSGNLMGAIADNISAYVGIFTSLNKIHDKKREKEIQRLQEQVESLKDAYEDLERAIDRAYYKSAQKLIQQQNQELRQQKVLIQQQIAAEEDKKDTDNERIKEWRNALKEIDILMEENNEKATDAIFGEDIKSAIDNFAQAYADAWNVGEDKAKAMKDVVKNMIRNIIKQMLKDDLGTAVKDLRARIEEYLTDDIINSVEQAELDRLVEQMVANMDNKYAWADKYMLDDASREASKKGFASMSQDSAEELNGRFTAIQALAYTINENTRILVTNSGMILQHLSGIRDNTEFCRRLDGMDMDLRSVKQSIDDINVKGIKIRV